jgi:arginine decarboxylase
MPTAGASGWGERTFRSDLLATAGLDDRKSSHGYLSQAEQLMAAAVGAGQAFFSACGSSLSVKAVMLVVAGGGTACWQITCAAAWRPG